MRWKDVLLIVSGAPLFLLLREPLFVVGSTAISDTVYLWGSDGLAFWNDSLVYKALDALQKLAFFMSVVTVALAWLHRWIAWSAALTLSVGVSLATAQACTIAQNLNDIIPVVGPLSGGALSLYAIGLLILYGAVSSKAPAGHSA